LSRKTYIFDLDGTLLNTLQDLAAAVNYALRQNGMEEHSIDDIRHFVGNGVRKLIERSVPAGTSASELSQVFADFRAYYMQHSQDSTRPYDGICEMLQELKKQGCKMAVVSNKMMAATKELVAHFFPEIEVAIGENEAAGLRKKPAPDMVHEALQQLHAEAGTAIYVGDSDVDIQTAKNAGLPCISVLWGFRNKTFLTEHGAQQFAEKPADLVTI